MGANFGDLDNDGWLDVYLGTGDSTYQALLPNRMFRQRRRCAAFRMSRRRETSATCRRATALPLPIFAGSGFEDVFEEMGGAQPGDTYRSALYHNPGNGNHWITLRLEGVRIEPRRLWCSDRATVKAGQRQTAQYLSHGRLRLQLWGQPTGAAHRHRRSRTRGEPDREVARQRHA